MKKKQKMEDEVYNSRKGLSLAKGIPIEQIKAAHELHAEGIRPNGRIYWKEFEPWYLKHKEAIEEYLEDSDKSKTDKTWKERKDRAMALIAEIQLQNLQMNTLDKEQVITFLKQVSSAQAIVLRNMSQDLPHRLLGKDITTIQLELSKAYDSVCSIFAESLETWTTKKQP